MRGLWALRRACVLAHTLPRVVLATSEPAPALALHAVRLAYDHEVLVVSRVRIDVAKAAARVNELVGTETEDGQAEAWEELDAALGDVQFAEVSA